MIVKQRIVFVVALLIVAVLISSCASPTEEVSGPQTATVEPTAEQSGTQPSPTGTATRPPTPVAALIPPAVQMALDRIQRLEGATLARVDGEEITWEDYEPTLRQTLVAITTQYGLNWDDPAMEQRLAQLQDDVLKQTVDRWLLRQIAADQGVTVSDADLATAIEEEKSDAAQSGRYADWDEFLQVHGLTESSFRLLIHDTILLNRLLAAQPVDAQDDQVRLAHIAMGDEATAQEVLAKLQAGEDFADLVQQYSVDTQTKENDGDLGWFTYEMLQPEVAQVVFDLEPGQVSGVVANPQGYVIYRVLEHQVRELDPRALRVKQQQVLMTQLETVRAGAQIEYLVSFAAGQE